MHFGASSMVWPMNWGKESGTSVIPAFLGAFITSLFLVLLGYVALARGNGTFNTLSNRILGNKLGRFYTSLSIVILGPLYAIPRMSAAAWDSLAQAFSLQDVSHIYLILFTVIFYIVTYIFLVSPGKAMERISNILFPFLLVIVIAIIFRGLTNPISSPVEKIYPGSAFAYGFTNGYATGEILCALIFGVVIFNTLEYKGVVKERYTSNLIKVGIAGIGMLTCTHLAHMLIGANTGEVFADLNYTSLYTAVATHLLGRVGGMIFCFALVLAALTTAIGMASGCAEFFVEMSNEKINYKTWSIIILVLCVLFGSMGLTNILGILGPILDGVYPAAIVFVVFYSFCPDTESNRWVTACNRAMLTALVLGLVDTLYKYALRLEINPANLVEIYESIPLTTISMAWLPVTVLAFILGYVFYNEKKLAAKSKS